MFVWSAHAVIATEHRPGSVEARARLTGQVDLRQRARLSVEVVLQVIGVPRVVTPCAP